MAVRVSSSWGGSRRHSVCDGDSSMVIELSCDDHDDNRTVRRANFFVKVRRYVLLWVAML
jgi:hypothetical protein